MSQVYEMAKEYLRYNPKNGKFYWIKSTNNRSTIGDEAGNVNKSSGYVFLGVNSRRFLAHRLAYYMAYGKVPRMVDHINRKRADNRIKNLREITDFASNVNKKPHRKAKSGLRGAYMYNDRRKKPYKAQARLPSGKIKFLGAFFTAAEAQAAYLSHYKGLGIDIDLTLDG